MGSASILSTTTGFSTPSSGFIAHPSMRERAWAWPRASESCNNTADAFGWNRSRVRDRRSASRSPILRRPRHHGSSRQSNAHIRTRQNEGSIAQFSQNARIASTISNRSGRLGLSVPLAYAWGYIGSTVAPNVNEGSQSLPRDASCLALNESSDRE